jgi:hypothetical protein
VNIDPDIADMVAKFLAVNAAATLLLAVLAYIGSALILNWLQSLDKWLDASQKKGNANLGLKETFNCESSGSKPTRGSV